MRARDASGRFTKKRTWTSTEFDRIMHHLLIVFLTVTFMVVWLSGRGEVWGLVILGLAIVMYVFMPRWDDH